jgi:hypothetical protein
MESIEPATLQMGSGRSRKWKWKSKGKAIARDDEEDVDSEDNSGTEFLDSSDAETEEARRCFDFQEGQERVSIEECHQLYRHQYKPHLLPCLCNARYSRSS